MRVLITTILVTFTICSNAIAQQRSVGNMVNDMRARHGQAFEQYQALATSRGIA